MTGSSLLDDVSEREIEIEISVWKKILAAVLDAILFLAKNNLAFRGPSSNILDDNCGNFLALIKLLGNYYPPLATHLERAKKHRVSYLSPQIQNEFIAICGNHVKQAILSQIRNSKYFSILFDSTPDSSRQEQLSEVIRTVICSRDGCFVKEYFVDFIASEQKTGHGLSEVVIAKLKSDGLDISFCRGQGYDNGANMAGAYNGVQSWISSVSPKAQFIPCAAHSLNLVGVNAAERVPEAKLSLGQIQNLFQYFHASTGRWQYLNARLSTNLKGQSTTRWSSRCDSVQALATQYWTVVETLIEISTSNTFNAESIAGADSQLNLLLTYKFLLCVKIWNKVLYQINLCNLTLQKESGNLEIASKKFQALLNWLIEFRSTGFPDCLSEAETLATEYGIDFGSGFEDKRRTRGAKRKQLEELSEDAAKDLTNFQKFEASFFNELLDNIISEIGSRFGQIRSCNEDFNFLWGVGLAESSHVALVKSVLDLCQKYEGDYDAHKFSNEVKYWKHQVSLLLLPGKTIQNSGPLDAVDAIYKHELESCFPNVATAIKIFLTLPVTVASNERSFSKLKIIKNYLRSKMGQERLSCLSILSIEYEVTNSLSFDELISKFSTSKLRKVAF